jgi:hypothetical protein
LAPLTAKNRDEYINEFLGDVISHEAGHCMGLRHNFVSSTNLTFNQLRDANVTREQGIAASVMDYTPANMAAIEQGHGDFYTHTVGPYDMFAIDYGYRVLSGGTSGERPALMAIASKGSMPGNAYMTDEEADSFDPYVVRFDNSRDPIQNASATIRVAKKLLSKAEITYPKPGRPYSDLSRVVQMMLMQSTQQCIDAARFVGGLAGSRNFRGDPKERATLKPVQPSRQREALQMISRELFAEDSFKLSERVLVNLAAEPDSPGDGTPIKDLLSALQLAVLSNLWSADTIDRVVNNEFKTQSQPDRFTLSELYGTVAGKVFAEVGTGRRIGPLRRDLQRFAVEALIAQALSRPGAIQEDSRVIAWQMLKGLRSRLGKATSADSMTNSHLSDLANRIERASKSIVTSGR